MTQKKGIDNDVLGDLLRGGGDTEFASELDALDALITQTGAIIKSPSTTEKKKPSSQQRTPTKGKKKSTYYVTEETFAHLDKAKVKIKQQVPATFKKHISKSQIINQALGMILRDFEIKGDDSLLMKRLMKKHTPPKNE